MGLPPKLPDQRFWTIVDALKWSREPQRLRLNLFNAVQDEEELDSFSWTFSVKVLDLTRSLKAQARALAYVDEDVPEIDPDGYFSWSNMVPVILGGKALYEACQDFKTFLRMMSLPRWRTQWEAAANRHGAFRALMNRRTLLKEYAVYKGDRGSMERRSAEMADLPSAILRLASQDPTFRGLLQMEMTKEAASISDARFWEIVKELNWSKEPNRLLENLFEAVEDETELYAFAGEVNEKAARLLTRLRGKWEEEDGVRVWQKLAPLQPAVSILLSGGKKDFEEVEDLKTYLEKASKQRDTNNLRPFLMTPEGLVKQYMEYEFANLTQSEEASALVKTFREGWSTLTDELRDAIRSIDAAGKDIEAFLDAWSRQDRKKIQSSSESLPGALARVMGAVDEIGDLTGNVYSLQNALQDKLLGMLRNQNVRMAQLKTASMDKEALRLNQGDMKVIEAFVHGRPHSSKRLTTDGKTLDGLWMGGNGIATRNTQGFFFIEDIGSKAAQTVQNYLMTQVPANRVM